MTATGHRPITNLAVFIALGAVHILTGACEQAAPQTTGSPPPSNDPPWFEEVAESSGLKFVSHSQHHDGRYLYPDNICGGAALFDMDGDGDLDVYLVQAGRLTDDPSKRPANQLFENLGDGQFRDVTDGSGTADRGWGLGVATGDYDNDGDVDLYVTNLGPNVMLRNDGEGRFTDVTKSAGVADPGFSTSCAFLDYDADGDLDLYVANNLQWTLDIERPCTNLAGQPDYCGPESYADPSPDTLYRNNGDGTFTDVSIEAGLRGAYGNGLGVVCGDFNLDGLIDIFVANDTTLNQLWQNQGDGTFKDIAMITGCAMDQHGQAKAGMGTTAADIDDDGDLDLFVVNLRSQSDSFFRNNGSFFSDDTGVIGMGTTSQPFTRFGMAVMDFDNDGWLDLYLANGRVERLMELTYANDPYAEPNLLLRGSAGGRFEEVLPRGGTSSPLIATSRAAAFGDINNDGGIDILVANRDSSVHLLKNVVPNRGQWIMFRAVDEHGRDALGATITMRLGDRTLSRDVQSGYSYLAANDPRVHVGLGDLDQVSDVTVRWIGGERESFGTFKAGRIVQLRRGAGEAAK